MFALALCGTLLAPAMADTKAEQTASALTPSEQRILIRGDSGNPLRNGARTGALGSAGYVPGVPRLGVPALQETDEASALPTRKTFAGAMSQRRCLRGSPSLRRGIPRLAYRKRCRFSATKRGAKVSTCLLGPGLNLTREPRGGRDFEYLGRRPPARRNACRQRDLRNTRSPRRCDDEALCVKRSRDRPFCPTLSDISEAGNARERSARVRDRDEGGSSRRCDVRLQPRQRRLCLRERAPLERGSWKRDWNFPGWVMSDWGAVRSAAAAAQRARSRSRTRSATASARHSSTFRKRGCSI